MSVYWGRPTPRRLALVVALADVRFRSHCGLKSDSAPGPKSAILLWIGSMDAIDADHGDCGIGCLRHGVLPRLWRPLPASLAGGAGARPDHPINRHLSLVMLVEKRIFGGQ
jgi:hypothetical protein